MNWKIVKTISMSILGITAATLVFPTGVLGLPGLTEKVFGMNFNTIMGIGLGYVAWAMNKFSNTN